MGWFGGGKPTARRDPNDPPGAFGAYRQRLREKNRLAAEQAAADKLASTTPVAPPPTTLLASTNVDLARGAAERMRKRTGGGALLPGAGVKSGPKAKLQPKTLIGGY